MSIRIERGLSLPKPHLDRTSPKSGALGSETIKGADFGASIGAAFADIEGSAKIADQAAENLVVGKIDLHEAMVKMEKADLMLKLGSTVRTKLVDAYQKLMAAGSG